MTKNVWPYSFEWANREGWTMDAASDSFAELVGASPEQLKESAWPVVLGAHVDLAASVLDETAMHGRWEGRLKIRSMRGADLMIQLECWSQPAAGGEMVVLGKARDVTCQALVEDKLRQIEARLKLVGDRLALSMWSFDPELRVTWHWGWGLEIFGYEENEFVGSSLSDRLQGEEEAQAFLDRHLEALKGRRVTFDFVFRDRKIRTWLEPHVTTSGEILGVSGFAIDLTALGPLGESSEVQVADDDEVITIGDLVIMVGHHSVSLGGSQVDLTPNEFKLLVEFARRPGHVFSRSALLEHVWDYNFLGSGSVVSTAMMRLRSKLDAAGGEGLIETVRGVGYRLVEDTK